MCVCFWVYVYKCVSVHVCVCVCRDWKPFFLCLQSGSGFCSNAGDQPFLKLKLCVHVCVCVCVHLQLVHAGVLSCWDRREHSAQDLLGFSILRLWSSDDEDTLALYFFLDLLSMFGLIFHFEGAVLVWSRSGSGLIQVWSSDCHLLILLGVNAHLNFRLELTKRLQVLWRRRVSVHLQVNCGAVHFSLNADGPKGDQNRALSLEENHRIFKKAAFSS